MIDFKRFWKSKFFIIPLIMLLVVLVAAYGIHFWIKLNFIAGNDVILFLSPVEKSLELSYGEKQTIGFNLTTKNSIFCKALCEYEFVDRSQNLALDKGRFNITRNQQWLKKYMINATRLGTGQDLYNFQVKCENIKTFFCPSTGQEIIRSSFVTANYDLNEIQKVLKRELKANVTRFLNKLAVLDESLQELNQKIFEFGAQININNLIGRKIAINDGFDELVIRSENLRAIWATEDYVRLSRTFNSSFFNEIDSLNNGVIGLEKSLNEAIDAHNTIVDILGEFTTNHKKLSYISNVLVSDEINNTINNTIKGFNNLLMALENRNFESYSGLKDSAEQSLAQQKNHIRSSNNLSLPVILKGKHLLAFEKDLLCKITNCTVPSNIEPVIEAVNNLHINAKLFEPDTFIQTCNDMFGLITKYEKLRNDSGNFIETNEISFPDTEEFKDYMEKRKGNLTLELNKIYSKQLDGINKLNKTDINVANTYSDILSGENKTIIFSYDEEFEKLNLSLYHLLTINYSMESQNYLGNICNKLGISGLPELYNFTPKRAAINFTFHFKSKLNTTLPEILPMCCVFGSCNPCCNDESCRDDPGTFPIMFLHGHSVLRDSSVEYSLDAYNKLQHRLQEDGYINAGILSLYTINDEIKDSEWGLSGKPVTVKVSYYFDAFKKGEYYIVVPTKSESIDTYAVRLKELVEEVKRRTGKPKVDIIANSMGGLVARRHIQIFGENSVHKLIMTGTPNKGIVGKVRTFCPLFGESLECRDMQTNSLFLNVLNDPDRQPKDLRMHVIAGSGCDTDGKDGDGIVQLEHATLPNAKNHVIKGSCKKGFLHTDMLDTDKYPEVYEIIRDILK